MKCRIVVEIELDIKPRYSKMVQRESSDRGKEFVEITTVPTQSDITEYLEDKIHSGAKYPFALSEDDRFVPCVITHHVTLATELIPG